MFEDPGFGPCTKCHSPLDESVTPEKIALGNAAATFPGYVMATRQVMPLETFLSWHLAAKNVSGYLPQSQEVIDLAAYLAKQAEGKRVCAGRLRKGKGENP